MRILVLTAWLLIPVAAWCFHHGPGQEHIVLDDVAGLLAEADTAAAAEQWSEAVACYEEALGRLPSDRVELGWRIRLERAKAQMFIKQLPLAHADLKILVDELSEAAAPDDLLSDARATLANSQYYMTWLMRLEGQPRDAWEPEIEAARQTYRLLGERADAAGQVAVSQRHRQDLESVIRLARMDLGELEGLPLPSQ